MWHAGEDVARKEGFSVRALAGPVAFHARDHGQVMRHALGGEQGGEFFLAARFGVTDPPRFVGGGAERRKRGNVVAHAFSKNRIAAW